MKKRFLNVLTVVILTILLSASLCACGKKQVSTTNSGESKVDTEESALSKCFSTNSDAVWYYISTDAAKNGISKDTYISRAYVFENGKCERYDLSSDAWNSSQFTLGDFSKMKDKDIITALENNKSKQIEAIQSRLKNISEFCDRILNNLTPSVVAGDHEYDYDFTALKNSLEQGKEKISSFQFPETDENYKMAVYTDATGNNASKECIVYNYESFEMSAPAVFNSDIGISDQQLYTGFKECASCSSDFTPGCSKETIKFEALNKECEMNFSTSQESENMVITNPIDATRGSIQIYDSYYGGYVCEDGTLITKTKDQKNFELDSVGTDGVEVDPTSGFPSVK